VSSGSSGFFCLAVLLPYIGSHPVDASEFTTCFDGSSIVGKLVEYGEGKLGCDSMDCFWVEATHEEAIQSVFPMLSPELQLESEQLAVRCERLAEEISQPPRPFCFLVARDLSSIDPFEVHYPFHQFWGAYSPFR
jgi:hypothetical protein